MKRKLLALAVAAVLPGLVATAHAQSNVGGEVTTNTRVGAVLQNNVGIGNTNEAKLGSVSQSRVGGEENKNTRVVSILQNYVGIGNTNEAAVGSAVNSRVGGNLNTNTRVGAILQ